MNRESRAVRVTALALMAGAIAAMQPGQAAASTKPPVAAYSIAPTPIAATGTLGTSGSVPLVLTVQDATGQPIPGGLVWLVLVSVMPDGHVRPYGMGRLIVNATPIKVSKGQALYRAGKTGTLLLTYTATTNGTPRYRDMIDAHRFFSSPGPFVDDSYTY